MSEPEPFKPGERLEVTDEKMTDQHGIVRRKLILHKPGNKQDIYWRAIPRDQN